MMRAALLCIPLVLPLFRSEETVFTPKDRSELFRAGQLWHDEKEEALAKYGPIKKWVISKVTELQHIFRGNREFGKSPDDDISHWDTSHVTTMEGLFQHCEHFNMDIGHWDTSKVTNMDEMFQWARFFEHDLSKWDTSKVTIMADMFYHAEAFNHPIGKWDVSKVTDMKRMFMGAYEFDQDISKWDVSKVTDMTEMFRMAYHFHQDITGWDTSSVKEMKDIFFQANSFNYTEVIAEGKWDLSNLHHHPPEVPGDTWNPLLELDEQGYKNHPIHKDVKEFKAKYDHSSKLRLYGENGNDGLLHKKWKAHYDQQYYPDEDEEEL